jgi:hypothetical protein
VIDTPERLAAFECARQDVCDAGKIVKLEVQTGPTASVLVELAAEPAK